MPLRRKNGDAPQARRPTHFWQPFNTWWRAELEATGKRPRKEQIKRWYAANADRYWRDLEQPATLEETRIHAKCLRSKEQVKSYFRLYRATKRAGTAGGSRNKEGQQQQQRRRRKAAAAASASEAGDASCASASEDTEQGGGSQVETHTKIDRADSADAPHPAQFRPLTGTAALRTATGGAAVGPGAPSPFFSMEHQQQQQHHLRQEVWQHPTSHPHLMRVRSTGSSDCRPGPASSEVHDHEHAGGLKKCMTFPSRWAEQGEQLLQPPLLQPSKGGSFEGGAQAAQLGFNVSCPGFVHPMEQEWAAGLQLPLQQQQQHHLPSHSHQLHHPHHQHQHHSHQLDRSSAPTALPPLLYRSTSSQAYMQQQQQQVQHSISGCGRLNSSSVVSHDQPSCVTTSGAHRMPGRASTTGGADTLGTGPSGMHGYSRGGGSTVTTRTSTPDGGEDLGGSRPGLTRTSSGTKRDALSASGASLQELSPTHGGMDGSSQVDAAAVGDGEGKSLKIRFCRAPTLHLKRIAPKLTRMPSLAAVAAASTAAGQRAVSSPARVAAAAARGDPYCFGMASGSASRLAPAATPSQQQLQQQHHQQHHHMINRPPPLHIDVDSVMPPPRPGQWTSGGRDISPGPSPRTLQRSALSDVQNRSRIGGFLPVPTPTKAAKAAALLGSGSGGHPGSSAEGSDIQPGVRDGAQVTVDGDILGSLFSFKDEADDVDEDSLMESLDLGNLMADSPMMANLNRLGGAAGGGGVGGGGSHNFSWGVPNPMGGQTVGAHGQASGLGKVPVGHPSPIHHHQDPAGGQLQPHALSPQQQPHQQHQQQSPGAGYPAHLYQSPTQATTHTSSPAAVHWGAPPARGPGGLPPLSPAQSPAHWGGGAGPGLSCPSPVRNAVAAAATGNEGLNQGTPLFANASGQWGPAHEWLLGGSPAGCGTPSAAPFLAQHPSSCPAVTSGGTAFELAQPWMGQQSQPRPQHTGQHHVARGGGGLQQRYEQRQQHPHEAEPAWPWWTLPTVEEQLEQGGNSGESSDLNTAPNGGPAWTPAAQ